MIADGSDVAVLVDAAGGVTFNHVAWGVAPNH